MSLYNLINGVNLSTFFILPMLGKHPEEYPRFRDCFLKDDEHPQYDNYIHVYTRVGGNNRNCEYNEEELYKHPNFVATFDDNFDSTYATYVFSVPEKWKDDFDKIVNGKIKEISIAYKLELYRIFPKLKEKFDILFSDVVPEVKEGSETVV
jgi:hypothetical protein